MRKAQNMFSWVVIASEVSHVFCCILPGIFSVVTILVRVGLVGAMPIWMDSFHDVMHDFEIPLMTLSGVVVLLGWGLHYVAKKINCHDTGCSHGGCSSKKRKSLRILKIATVLFVVNITIYIGLHKSVEAIYTTEAVTDTSEHHDHHH